jgi:molybdenum cofactor biosynthesis enzyme MoaA
MLDVFQRLLDSGKVSYSPLTAIRVKVHVPCQWKCEFCHMEGNHFSSPIQGNKAFASALSLFREHFGFEEVHYTGGEPSIHPHIVDLIKTAKALGFRVKMTTNGQTELEQYEKCIRAGLEEINVSVHTLDGKSLGEIMFPPRKAEWGKRAVDRQLSFITSLRNKISVKINTCVGENESEALRIADFAFSEGIGWRPMNILSEYTKFILQKLAIKSSLKRHRP